MNILVTGAAGLIGSHLCDLLLNQGHTVIGIDNLLNGKRENIPSDVRFFNWDIVNKLDFDYFNSMHVNKYGDIIKNIDRLYHLACPASPVHYQKTPIQTMLSNIVGTYNMLQLAYDFNARFLFTSSSEVYGDTKLQPINETQIGENINILSDRSCYVEGKRAAETLIWNYIKVKEVDIRVTRLFNCYGPRMAKDDGRVIANFIHNRPITIHGTGEQKRSFCYVTDTVEGINLLMESNVKKPINIGNPSGYISINKLADMIIELMGEDKEKYELYNEKIFIEDRSDSEVYQRIPDISEATYYLKWSPKVGLAEGLKKTIKEIENDK
jgi:UDP-glucuronate decarboxylase